VTLYQDYIRQTSKATGNPTVNISSVNKTGGKRKFDAVEDRYYTKEEYTSLTPEQKKDLVSKRHKRGHKPGARDSKVAKGKGGAQASPKPKPMEVIQNLQAVNRQISQLAKQMTKTSVKDDDSSTGLFSKSMASEPKKQKAPIPNRSYAALTRQKKASIEEPKK
jgi:hypothetical protein